MVQDTATETAADADGNFSLQVPFDSANMEITYLGYIGAKLKACKSDSATAALILLNESPQILQEVLVSHYAVMSKREVVASASSSRSKSQNSERDKRSKEKKEHLSIEERFHKAPNKIRSHFSDYAFWQPNLTTDSSGKAIFNATFPENSNGRQR